MNSDGKIHVIIQKGETNNEIQAITQDEVNTNTGKISNIERPNVQRQAIATALIQNGQQMLSQGINSYTQMSGNYEFARSVNNFTSISADILTIAKGGVVGIVAVAAKFGLEAINKYTNQINNMRKLNYDNQQLGMISREGSRYY